MEMPGTRFKEIKYAQMDQPIHTPETGQYGPRLSNKADPTQKAVKMMQLENDVLIEIPYISDPKKFNSVLVSNTRFHQRTLV